MNDDTIPGKTGSGEQLRAIPNPDATTLADLAREWIAIRDAREAAHPPNSTPGLCRFCGEPWRHWAGSRLTGHARCVAPAEFRARLIAWLQGASTVTFRGVADALDVTIAVLRAWWRIA